MPTHALPHDLADSETPIPASSHIPVQTTFRHMRTSAAVTDHIMRHAQKLSRHFARITQCHVVVTAPHKHHLHKRPYVIHVELGVPQGPLIVTHEGTGRAGVAAHDDIYVTLRETFDIVRRRLEDHARRLRGDIKRHEPLATNHSAKKGARSAKIARSESRPVETY